MNVKALIESRIKEQGFTKKSFAEAMGISPTNLNSMIESPSFPTLTKVAATLEMSLSELLDEGSMAREREAVALTPSGRLVCPHCGKSIEIEVKGVGD